MDNTASPQRKGAETGTSGNSGEGNQRNKKKSGNKNNPAAVGDANSELVAVAAESGAVSQEGDKAGTTAGVESTSSVESAGGQIVVSTVPLSGIAAAAIGEVVPGQFSDASSSDGEVAAAPNTIADGGAGGDPQPVAVNNKSGDSAEMGVTLKSLQTESGANEQKDMNKKAVGDASALAVDSKKKVAGKAGRESNEKTLAASAVRNTQPLHTSASEPNQQPAVAAGTASASGLATATKANPPAPSAASEVAILNSSVPLPSAMKSNNTGEAQNHLPLPDKSATLGSSAAPPATAAVPLQHAQPPAGIQTVTTSPVPTSLLQPAINAPLHTANQPSKPQTPMADSLPISAPPKTPQSAQRAPDGNRIHQQQALPLPRGATTAAEAAAAAVAAANAASASSLPTSTITLDPSKAQTTPAVSAQNPAHANSVIAVQHAAAQGAAFNNPPASIPTATSATAVLPISTPMQFVQASGSNKLSQKAAPAPGSVVATMNASVSAPPASVPVSINITPAAKPIIPVVSTTVGGVAIPPNTAAKSLTKASKSAASSSPRTLSSNINTTAIAESLETKAISTNVSSAGGALPLPHLKAGEPPQIADPTVIKAVHDIIALLQTYGPLTHDQLEYNLPPLEQTSPPSTLVGVSSTHRETSGGRSDAASKLQQILDILVVTGVVNIIADNPMQESEGHLSTALDSTQSNFNGQAPNVTNSIHSDNARASLHFSPQPPRYAFLHGVPRADTIMPHQLLSELRRTHKEVEQTKKRIEILKNELRVISDDDFDTSGEEKNSGEGPDKETDGIYTGNEKSQEIENTTSGITGEAGTKNKKRKKERKSGVRSAREVLKTLLLSHPEIIYDPVYAAALRSLNVDIGAVDRERQRGYATSSKKRKASSSSSSMAKVTKAAEPGGDANASSPKKKKSTNKTSMEAGAVTAITAGTKSPSSKPVPLPVPGSST